MSEPHHDGVGGLPRVQVPVASGKNASSHTPAVSSSGPASPLGLCGFERQRGPPPRGWSENSGSTTPPPTSAATSAIASAPPLVSSRRSSSTSMASARAVVAAEGSG